MLLSSQKKKVKRIGQYFVYCDQILGTGGFATVYLAKRDDDTKYACKVNKIFSTCLKNRR
jgi:hypothetical protein